MCHLTNSIYHCESSLMHVALDWQGDFYRNLKSDTFEGMESPG